MRGSPVDGVEGAHELGEEVPVAEDLGEPLGPPVLEDVDKDDGAEEDYGEMLVYHIQNWEGVTSTYLGREVACILR